MNRSEKRVLIVEQTNHLLVRDDQHVVAVDGGRGRQTNGMAASACSPEKSPGPSIATTASLPPWDSTESLTAPF